MPLITKKDYFLVSIVGFFFGLFLLPVLNNIKFPFAGITFASGFLIVLLFTIFADFALFIVSLLAKLIPIVLQVAKFAAIGALNTLLDLGILNILILISGVAVGYWYSLFKACSFIIANINSYFWNKHWTFGISDKANVKEFGEFLAVSLVGFGLNIASASLVVNVITAPQNISPERWANIGALSATVISLIWNFIGYKFFVFKR